ncbi:MAG: FAD-dependent oxidoreductase [Pirellulales bacterium]|nr:FAD-dependent oxidoreductase [Pirellulales bacterium]
MNSGKLRQKHHQADFCVVGAGLAGMCAAVAAARHGLRVVLMHDRPLPGGNASPEIRMWIWGARGPNNRETGIIEELLLENRYRNPLRNYSLWGSILYEIVRFQENITLLLNCSCNGLEMDGDRIRSITGWQTTTQTWHTVEAGLFADCSGDSILAPLSGAIFHHGREAAGQFGESVAPAEASPMTMGMSLLLQPRQTTGPQPFIPPKWAKKFPGDDDLSHRDHDLGNGDWMWNNFWWIEAGGDRDCIHDAEEIRDELLRCLLGVWDHIKNQGKHQSENWMLDWFGFLPGKRESRRYQGDYLINQNDVLSGGQFDDVVAYGGWPMDDHHPGGLMHPGQPSKLYHAPSPWKIPYRALYSCNVPNLMFAGRNISASHVAFSSSRVMATCAIIGQAVGTAAAIAVPEGLTPRQVGQQHITRLQQMLMEDDCFLPGLRREIPALSRDATLAASEGDPEPLRNGVDRPVGDEQNGWTGPLGAWVQYTFEHLKPLRRLRLVFDSDLNRPQTSMLCKYPLNIEPAGVPSTLVRAFRVEALDCQGRWNVLLREDNNHHRLFTHPLDAQAMALRFYPETTWGAEKATVFAWDVE